MSEMGRCSLNFELEMFNAKGGLDGLVAGFMWTTISAIAVNVLGCFLCLKRKK